MNHARKNLLKLDGITIPEKVINLAELCNMDYIFDNIELKTAITQFTGIKQPRIMTESKVFNTFSFDRENAIEVKGSSEFKALTTGNINSVRLSSIVKIADGINFYSTDSMMPLEIVPLKNQRYVKEEQKIILTGTYKHNDIMNNVFFEVK
jgi:predicted RNA methylase